MESHQKEDFREIPEKFVREIKYVGHGRLLFGNKGSIVYTPEIDGIEWNDRYVGKKRD